MAEGNTCVCCGRIIPEGTMICLQCGSENEMQTFRTKVRTNGDRIRAMDDEQLAEFLHRIIRCCTNESCQGNKCPLYGACGQRIEQQKKWLKKEAEP